MARVVPTEEQGVHGISSRRRRSPRRASKAAARPQAHVTWVETETPWYATPCARNLAAVTGMGVCWLAAMDRYMGMQRVHFRKTCGGFL